MQSALHIEQGFAQRIQIAAAVEIVIRKLAAT